MCVFLPATRTLTELLKQPGEAGMVDGTGVHHPIGTNGISARALRSNNGESSYTSVCVYLCGYAWAFTLPTCGVQVLHHFCVLR